MGKKDSYILKRENLLHLIDNMLSSYDIDDEVYDITRKDFTDEFLNSVKEVEEGYLVTEEYLMELYDKLTTIIVDNTLTVLVKEGKIEIGVDKNGEFIFSAVKKDKQ